MSLIAFAALVAAQAVSTAPHEEANCVGYEELRSGEDNAALTAIDQSNFEKSDPAVLINEGIALARIGQYEPARARFEAVLTDNERVRLETASGEWVDARWLAKRGLDMIGKGEFQRYVALNAR